jgi:hypothetical protein
MRRQHRNVVGTAAKGRVARGCRLSAASASDIFPGLASLSVLTVQRAVTIALIPIFFGGGLGIGRRRFREAAGAIAWIGVVGTLVTTCAVALLAHLIFGFAALPALLLGAALAPTDPAVVFSVLGRKEITGRSGLILGGESGANDPVGIAIMVSLLAAQGATGWGAVGQGALEFTLGMTIGLGEIVARHARPDHPTAHDAAHRHRALGVGLARRRRSNRGPAARRRLLDQPGPAFRRTGAGARRDAAAGR